jgi:hypothetical protein
MTDVYGAVGHLDDQLVEIRLAGEEGHCLRFCQKQVKVHD